MRDSLNSFTARIPHFPSFTRNSRATTTGDGEYSITAFRRQCVSMLNLESSIPTHVEVPKGGFCAVPSCSPINFKSIKGYDARGYSTIIGIGNNNPLVGEGGRSLVIIEIRTIRLINQLCFTPNLSLC